MNESNQALWDVMRVALVCMMCVQIFGVYLNAAIPQEGRVIIYECDFNMGKSVLTAPCTIRGEWGE